MYQPVPAGRLDGTAIPFWHLHLCLCSRVGVSGPPYTETCHRPRLMVRVDWDVPYILQQRHRPAYGLTYCAETRTEERKRDKAQCTALMFQCRDNCGLWWVLASTGDVEELFSLKVRCVQCVIHIIHYIYRDFSPEYTKACRLGTNKHK